MAKEVTQGLQLAALVFGGPILTTAALVATFFNGREEQRKARNRARDAYNNSLRDRYVMVRSALEARQVVLGRQRVSGPLVYVGSYGTDREHLAFVLPIASHEIDAVEAIYFDDELVSLDGSGNVLSVNRRDLFSISTSGATFTLSSAPAAGSVTASVAYGTTTVSLGVSVAGSAVTVSGATAGQTGTVTITYKPATSPFVADASEVPQQTTITLNGSGTGSTVLPSTPTSGQVFVTYQPPDLANGTPPLVDLASFVSVVGSTVTVTGATDQAGQTVTVVWSGAAASTSRARVRTYLGAAGQAADSGLVSALTGVWTSAHTMSGMAYIVVELDYDPDAFPSGLPNVSARVRGAKLYDPRTGSTAWSENPALMMRYVALSPLFGNMSTAALDDVNIAAQATVCDTSSTYFVNGQSYTRALYTAGIAAKANQRPKDVLDELAKAMAGKWAFVDGTLRIKAGAYSAPVAALDESWLTDRQAPTVQPTAALTDVFNTMTGRFLDEAQDYREVPFPSVVSSEYIAIDGRPMPEDIAFGAVTFSGQAQQIAAVMMRDARQGVRCTLSCNMRAYPLEVFDTITVTLPRFGWVAKVFEVLDITWSLDAGIVLQLKETTPTIWALGTSFSAQDPAPNTLLPNPAEVPAVTGLTFASGTAQLLAGGDGSVISRIYASWTPITDRYVAEGGGVEVQWGLASTDPDTWQSVRATDSQSGVFLGPVQDGSLYLIRARAYNRLASGTWTAMTLHQVVGKTALPAGVSGLTPSAIAGGVLITVTPSTEQDVATGGALELRVGGANWAAATRIFRGPSDRYTWPWPAAGTYTLRAKWIDSSGNESATDTTTSVTVGNGNLVPTGGLQPDSATKVNVDSHDFGGATVGGTSSYVERTFVITPSVDCIIEFTASITAAFVLPDSGRGLYWAVQAGSGSDTTLGTCSSDSSARQNFVCATSFSATGGVTLTFKIISTYPGVGTGQTLYASTMRVTEIKR